MAWFRRRRSASVDSRGSKPRSSSRSVGTDSQVKSPRDEVTIAWMAPEAKMTSMKSGGKGMSSKSGGSKEVAENVKRLRDKMANRSEPRFEVHSKKFGHGAYGAVHQGTMISRYGSREVAIKVIPESRMRLEALTREAAIMERLSQSNHSSILRFYGWFTPGSPNVFPHGADSLPNLGASHCMVMEAATGGELFEYVSERRGLGERQAGALMGQICEALSVAHSLGVAHRDLKLENVLFARDPSLGRCLLKLIDWGLAHQHEIDPNGNPVAELLHSRCGSKSYMAPEVIQCSRQKAASVPGFDAFKADIWSLGICFFAMLFGFFPFEQSDVAKDWRAERAAQAEEDGGSVVGTIIKATNISPDARELLDSMLTFDAKRRASLAQVLASPFMFTHIARLRRAARNLEHSASPTGAEEQMDDMSTCSSSVNGDTLSDVALSAAGSDRGTIRSRRSSDWTPRQSVAIRQMNGRVSRQGSADTDVSISSVGSSVMRSVVRLDKLARPEPRREMAAAPLPPHRPYRCSMPSVYTDV